MKKYFILIAVATVALLSACSKNDDFLPNTSTPLLGSNNETPWADCLDKAMRIGNAKGLKCQIFLWDPEGEEYVIGIPEVEWIMEYDQHAYSYKSLGLMIHLHYILVIDEKWKFPFCYGPGYPED